MEVPLENYEKLVIRMRDCFTAGYTLPQYCIDNGIKKPLFVSEEKLLQFMWQVYVQFRYDKRMLPTFSVIDLPTDEVTFTIRNTVSAVKFTNFSELNPDDYDKIILLTMEKVPFVGDKVISFIDLSSYFIRKAYAEIPALNFLQRYPKVKLFYTILPNRLSRYEGGKEFLDSLDDFDDILKKIRAHTGEIVATPFDKFGYTNEEVEIINNVGGRITTNLDGTTVMTDNDHPLAMIKNGKRLTANQPEKFQNRIYFIGPCHFAGAWDPYDKTIESYLQQLINENNLPYRVENESQRCAGRYQDMFYNLNALNPAPGDIIFIWITSSLCADNIPFVDLSDAFDPPYDYREFFWADAHFNEAGYKRIAEKFFELLTANNFYRDKEFNYPAPPPAYHRYGIPPQFEAGGVKNFTNSELEQYKQSLRAKKIPIGAIVMNCNPFTLGHRYLVEYAAAKVVKLYIFVVEEDRSEFPFADRFELVKQGVKDIPNVEVIPSGKFIISQQTFSGYFNKASLQDVTVDSSEDVEIFGQEIAPTLGITVRFAGEEPKDNVTRQYNETMKKILPRYGIEFHEIPRKTFGDEVISASSVREALKVGDFDKIKQLVPETTYIYLRGRSSFQNNAKLVRKEFSSELLNARQIRDAIRNDNFDTLKDLLPDTTIDYLREQRTELMRRLTARLDIKLLSPEGDFQILSAVDDKTTTVLKPGWLQKNGVGYQIESCAENLELVVKAEVDGQIDLLLRGIDIRTAEDRATRIPYWIDYTRLTINDKIIFNNRFPAWHGKFYRHRMDAKADEEITIQVEWQPHND